MTAHKKRGRPAKDRPGSVDQVAADEDRLAQTSDTWAARLTRIRDDARREVAACRARVLAHDDLAEALCRPPLGYARPGQWSGFVPPAFWGGAANTSVRRAALVTLDSEARRRENAGS